MKNVVDGKIEIDCLIRGIADGFSTFFFPRRRDYAAIVWQSDSCMNMCHQRQLSLMRANHKGVDQKNVSA